MSATSAGGGSCTGRRTRTTAATLVTIAAEHHDAINQWLGRGAGAWRSVLEPLTPDQRRLFIDTLTAYEAAVSE